MVRYSIQIVPDIGFKKEIRALMIKLSRNLKKLDALNDRAHMTIITSFKTRKIDSFVNIIRSYNLNSFSISLVGPYLFGKNFLYLKPQKDNKIKEIHNKIIELVPKCRTTWVREEFQNINVSSKQKKYLKRK